MSTSSTPNQTCSHCGALLPAGVPESQCPRCLMAQVIEPTKAGDAKVALPPRTPEELAPLFPQLEILECLGRGGMGVVYKARQKSLNRLVALKLLAPERADDPLFAARFEKEAHALAALNHPNIVGVYDFGQAGGFYFLLMEFVDGVNLRRLLQSKRLTPKEALSIVPPICAALQCAHDRGIVHRDIKPENLLIDKAGVVKIADFGIAKIVQDDGAAEAGATRKAAPETMPFGTPDYAAPEQAHGHADHRADIYSLGVVLYEMLTGERPKEHVIPPSQRVQVDVRIDEIVLRALEKTPELRYATAAEFRTEVEAVTASPAPAPKWHAPDSGWGWFIGKLFGIEWTSRTAYHLANLSALGCLAFVGFVPLPGFRICFNFLGLFGLIGLAHLVELGARIRSGAPSPKRGGCFWIVVILAAFAVGFAALVAAYSSLRRPASPVAIIMVKEVSVSENVLYLDLRHGRHDGAGTYRGVIDFAGPVGATDPSGTPAKGSAWIRPNEHLTGELPADNGPSSWRVGFVFPNSALAQAAERAVHPIWLVTLANVESQAGTLFEVKDEHGQDYRALFTVTRAK